MADFFNWTQKAQLRKRIVVRSGKTNSQRGRIFYLLIACFVFYASPWLVARHLLSPDEANYDYFSTLLASRGKITSHMPAEVELGIRGLLPRAFVNNEKGQAAPGVSPGLIFLLGLFKLAFPDSWALIVDPLLATVAIYLCYHLSRIILEDDRGALWSALLLAVTPIFAWLATSLLAGMLNLVLFLAGLLALSKAVSENKKTYYIIFGACCGLLVWARYSSVIFLPALGFPIYWNWKRLRKRHLLLSLASGCFFIVLLMVYLNFLYGSPLATGYPHSLHRGFSTLATSSISGLSLGLELLLRPSLIWLRLNFLSIPVSFSLAAPVFVFSLVGLYLWVRRRRITWLKASLGLVILLLPIWFFGNFMPYGYGDPEVARENFLTLGSSFLRYLLPLLALLPIWATVALSAFAPSAQKPALLILIAFSLFTFVFAPWGLIEKTLARLYFRNVSNFVLAHTGEKTVVLTCYWDVGLFPHRPVFTNTRSLSRQQLKELTDSILNGGYSIAYVEHRMDKQVGQFLTTNYPVEIVGGPLEKKGSFMARLPWPKSHYPVVLYIVKAPSNK